MFEESFLENIIVNAPLGIVTTDLAGRITFINRVACRIHCQDDPLEVVRKNVSTIAGSNSHDFLLTYHSVLNREKEKATAEYSVISGEEEAFVRVTMTMLRDENYKPTGVLIMCEDVTEQRILRDKLVKEKQFSESVIETANLIIVGIRPDGGIILFNRAAEEMTGYDRQEVIGKDWFELFGPEDERADIVEAFCGIIDGKTPTYHEHPIIIRNGKQRLIGWHETCIADAVGRTIGVIAIGEDITEKRKLEEQLISERERLELILTSLGAGLFLISRDYRITYANPLIEKDFGKCVGEKCYRALRKTLAAGQSRGICRECPVREIFDSGVQQATAEKRGRNLKGEEFWVQLVATPIMNDKEEVVCAIELIVPITERKKLEEQLIQAQKMEAVGILAGGIAHDFNNILGAIQGYTSLIKTYMDEADRNYRYVDMIHTASKHATSLAERLLSFSRRTKKRPTFLSFSTLIKNVLVLAKSSIKTNIKVKTDFAKDVPLVYGDRTQLEQLLLNVVINARDAMPNGGSIKIKTSRTKLDNDFCKGHLGAQAGENAVISISDTVKGMSEETCKRIFEPFFTTKKEGEGTGLGLSIAYSVVRSHKGYLDVESREGKGTTFTVYLPASRQKTARPRKKKDRISPTKETVLVVDKQDEARALLKDSLCNLGYKVILASNGNEAIEIFEKCFNEIDLAIIEMIMPDKNGKQALREMRKIKPNIKAIISSSKSAKASELRTIKRGGEAEFIKKPYELDELSLALQKLLGS